MLGYDFDVEYVPGPSNVIPDALSRLDYPLPERPPFDGGTSDTPSILRRLRNDLSCSDEQLRAYASIVIEKDKVDPEKEHKGLIRGSRAFRCSEDGASDSKSRPMVSADVL